jgi:hypothetical protein
MVYVVFVAALLAELGGLYFIVQDIRDAARRLRQYRERGQRMQLGTAYDYVSDWQPPGEPLAAPTPEEQISLISGRLRDLEQLVAALPNKLRMQVREEFSNVAQTVDANARERVERLSLVVGLEQRGVGRTWLGPGLFVIGLVLGFVGNVLSLAD